MKKILSATGAARASTAKAITLNNKKMIDDTGATHACYGTLAIDDTSGPAQCGHMLGT